MRKQFLCYAKIQYTNTTVLDSTLCCKKGKQKESKAKLWNALIMALPVKAGRHKVQRRSPEVYLSEILFSFCLKNHQIMSNFWCSTHCFSKVLLRTGVPDTICSIKDPVLCFTLFACWLLFDI